MLVSLIPASPCPSESEEMGVDSSNKHYLSPSLCEARAMSSPGISSNSSLGPTVLASLGKRRVRRLAKPCDVRQLLGSGKSGTGASFT